MADWQWRAMRGHKLVLPDGRKVLHPLGAAVTVGELLAELQLGPACTATTLDGYTLAPAMKLDDLLGAEIAIKDPAKQSVAGPPAGAGAAVAPVGDGHVFVVRSDLRKLSCDAWSVCRACRACWCGYWLTVQRRIAGWCRAAAGFIRLTATGIQTMWTAPGADAISPSPAVCWCDGSRTGHLAIWPPMHVHCRCKTARPVASKWRQRNLFCKL